MTTAWKSWFATRGRVSTARRLPHAAVAGDPFTHLDVREKLGLRAGGFGLLICQGMVDEMRYNDLGNEVTLIKRFVSPRPLPRGSGARRAAVDREQWERIEVKLDQQLRGWNSMSVASSRPRVSDSTSAGPPRRRRRRASDSRRRNRLPIEQERCRAAGRARATDLAGRG